MQRKKYAVLSASHIFLLLIAPLMVYNNINFYARRYMAMSERKEKKEYTPSESTRRDIYEWIQCVISALMICVVMFVFFARVIEVNGRSMLPTLKNGEKMLVSDLFYEPKAGDVVVFKKDEYDPNKALVKRVIATEGQVVNIDFDAGVVYVSETDENGDSTEPIPLDEPYINDLTHNKLDFIGPKTVPEGCVFVMGDNRNESTDSRDSRIAMVDERLIIGKVYCVIYPIDNFGFVN